MIGIEIRLKPRLRDGVRALKVEIENRINEGFSSVLETTETAAREKAPSRSGRLRNSVRTHLDAPLKGSIIAGAPYASFLHEGTGLFGPRRRKIVIKPRCRKAISWYGARHPVRGVVQRGIRPMNFMTHALRDEIIKSVFSEGFSNG